MKITVLDGYTLNPGDLDWTGITTLGETSIYERTPQSLVVDRIADSEIVLTNKTIIDQQILLQCPNIKYIGVLATGYNVVDVLFAKSLGILVTNIPAYASNTVAQHTFALILELMNRVSLYDASVKKGEWTSSADFTYQLTTMSDLNGKTMGLIGYGLIGKKVAKIASAFGMRVLVYTRTPFEDGISKCCSFEQVLSESDILSLHCPLTEATDQMMNQKTISQMKNGAILINTSRGGLVNETALTEALNSGKLSSAAVDVVSAEPISADNPLLSAKNIIITPHTAWASKEARMRLMNTAADNIKCFLAGNPINVINI